MKPLLFPLLLALSIPIRAQIFPTIEPHFPRPGLVWVIKDPPKIVPYVSVMAGPMKNVGLILKVSGGVGISLKPEKGDKGTARILVGLNHTDVFKSKSDAEYIRRYSIEAGIMVTRGRLSIMALTDPFISTEGMYLESRFGVSWAFEPIKRRIRQVECSSPKNSSWSKKFRK
jgi:hypothetical protein